MLLTLEKMKFSLVIHWLSCIYVIGLFCSVAICLCHWFIGLFFQIVGGSEKIFVYGIHHIIVTLWTSYFLLKEMEAQKNEVNSPIKNRFIICHHKFPIGCWLIINQGNRKILR